MRSASLFDCFERHLGNLEILCETDDLFVAKVIEDYILNLSHLGFTMGSHAEDIYMELQEEVQTMLQTKIYGFFSIDIYRAHLRGASEPAA
jgi:hypothetical protein